MLLEDDDLDIRMTIVKSIHEIFTKTDPKEDMGRLRDCFKMILKRKENEEGSPESSLNLDLIS